MDGIELDKLSDEELDEKLLMWRCMPEFLQAQGRIVDAWQRKGNIVSMTGDESMMPRR